MPQIFFHLGKGRIVVDIPDSNLVGVYSPRTADQARPADDLIRESLAGPTGCEPIPSQVKQGDKALIVLDDVTRVTPARQILPHILSELGTAGVKDADVGIVFALGTHRYMTEEEMVRKTGVDAFKRFEVSNHYWRDEAMLRDLGTTRSGIPISVNTRILDADWSIGVGNIVAHRIAGYTGGGKIVQPGLSGAETTGLTHYNAGKYEGEEIMGVADNPVRKEMEEIAEKAGLKMITNVVLDGKSTMTGCLSGNPVQAHREGVKACDEIYALPIEGKADIVVVDSHPADIDMWQAVKALEAAELAVKPGGTIVMFSPCWEGVSSEHPELVKHGYRPPSVAEAMLESGEVTDLCSAAAMMHVGKIIEKARVILYTVCIPKEDTLRLGFEYASDPQEAVDMAIEGAGSSPEILAFKRAAEVVPKIVGGR
jgi:nickel-dependent lactate racemase